MNKSKLLSGTVIVKPSLFNAEGSQYDGNGQRNIYLEVLAGKFPKNGQIVTGTVANYSGFGCGENEDTLEDDRMMLIEFTQSKHMDKDTGEQVTYVDRAGNTHGSVNTNYTVLARLGALDYLNAKSAVGSKVIIDTVNTSDAVEELAETPEGELQA